MQAARQLHKPSKADAGTWRTGRQPSIDNSRDHVMITMYVDYSQYRSFTALLKIDPYTIYLTAPFPRLTDSLLYIAPYAPSALPMNLEPTSANGSVPQTRLFEAIDAYPWSNDAEFQAGLSAIVGSNTDPSQIERLTLRARCFYFAR